MSIWKKLRDFIKKPIDVEPVELVTAYEENDTAPRNDELRTAEMLNEVDFSHQGDLKAYVRGLTVPKEVIEGWISVGLLNPEEMKAAEKMIKIMIEDQKTHVSFT